MNDRKRISLPPPPVQEEAVPASAPLEAIGSPEDTLRMLRARREQMQRNVERMDVEIERFALETICGFTDDTQDVELYDGSLGVTREFVDEHEPRIAQLQWLDDLGDRFSGPGESPGNVSGARWGSGGLIARDLYLTAGHCLDTSGGGWERPSRNGEVIAPAEIAVLMRLNFGYQVDGTTGQVRTGVSFPILELLEYREGGQNLDYAIVRAGPNEQGRLPGDDFGVLATAQRDLVIAQTMLCLIQHPAGRPKKVEAGPMSSNALGRITYDSLDTLGGSSGAPILSPEGEVVGVHTNGGCSTFSGANRGVAIGAIREVSGLL